MRGSRGDVVRLIARTGYAVGRVTAESGRCLDGISLIFYRLNDAGGFWPDDRYESILFGRRSKPVSLGNGKPVIGIFGNAATDINRFGVIIKE
jgi:hypothetical protein